MWRAFKYSYLININICNHSYVDYFAFYMWLLISNYPFHCFGLQLAMAMAIDMIILIHL